MANLVFDTDKNCPFMKLDECRKQAIGENLNLEICKVCIKGRMEQSLFDGKVLLGKILDEIKVRQIN